MSEQATNTDLTIVRKENVQMIAQTAPRGVQEQHHFLPEVYRLRQAAPRPNQGARHD